MHRSVALVLLVTLPQASTFLFGGGCCQAPVMQSPCCGGGATSWAYAPPQVIGYERIPLYAKVPMPAPPQYIVRTRPAVQPRIIQAEPYYQSPPPPPPQSSYQPISQGPPPPNYQPSSYYPPPMDNMASGPLRQPTVTSVSGPMNSVIPPPQDKYDDGDVIVIETDDSRRRRMSKFVQPPPQGYVSQPVGGPQGYQQQPPQGQPQYGGPQQQQYGGQVEQGIEVTPDQINSGYQPLNQGGSQGQFSQSQAQFNDGAISDSIPSNYGSQSSQISGAVQSVANSAAFESAGIAPSARRLRKFKN